MHFPINYQPPKVQGQPVGNHEVAVEGAHDAFADTHRCPHCGFVISSPRQSINQHWTKSHPVQYSFRSDPECNTVLGTPQSQHNYHSTQPNDAFTSISNDISAARHGSQYYGPLLGGISPSPPNIGNNCVPSDILQMQSPNGYASYSPLSHMVDKDNRTFWLEATSSVSMPFVNSVYRQQHVIPQPCSPSYHPPLSDRPPLALGSSQFRTEVGSNYSDYLCYPVRPLVNQPNSIPTSLHSSSLPLPREHEAVRNFSCLWLLDGTPCGFSGTLDVLEMHSKSTHFPGRNNVRLKCRWKDCDYHKRDDPTVDVMRRDSMWRHLLEGHLGVRRST